MTNSSNSSQRSPLKLLVIHGLNNNVASFDPLVKTFEKLGYDVSFVILPIHGEDRAEAPDYDEASRIFDERIRGLTLSEYGVIAFSQGALYFDLWLRKSAGPSPAACVYLAPSFYIRRQKLIERLACVVPDSIPIVSLSPRAFTRYDFMKVGEYKLLLSGIEEWQREMRPSGVRTLILIDPQDELVDAKKTSASLPGVELVKRPELRFGLGIHHILFHPEYFLEEQWEGLVGRIERFFGDE